MKTARYQRGVAAVETALLIAATIILLPILLYLGRLTMHAIVLDKATYEAARIVAALPEEAHKVSGSATTMRVLAIGYIDQAAREAGLDTRPASDATNVLCDGGACGYGKPGTVTVNTVVSINNEGLQPSLGTDNGLAQIRLAPSNTVSYAP
jgi:Flp pilus assembly protein TadG